ncbi:MAG: sigma factor-like helix-turn-helix DNA-binding protein [Candidatus Gracilibacteria bacterium]
MNDKIKNEAIEYADAYIEKLKGGRLNKDDTEMFQQAIKKHISGKRDNDILIRHFALGGTKESLESIGKTYGITRERVRQIEERALVILKEGIRDDYYEKQKTIYSMK